MTEILIILSAAYLIVAYSIFLEYVENTKTSLSLRTLAWFVFMSIIWPIKVVLYDCFQIDNRDGLKWYEARYEDCKYVWPLSFPVLFIAVIIIIIVGMYLK